MSNEQDYIEYKKQDKNIKLHHKADFYAFHTDFLNVSGITMDIDPPYLFGTLPNSEINFGVLGTGFYVSKEHFNHPNVEHFESNLISYKSTEQLKKVSEIKELLRTKECEFLDFKSEMYKIHDENAIRKDLERVELLRDILSLVNIKRTDKMIKISYLIIGIEEENEQFNGNHKNIDFRDNQTIYNLIKDYINPSLTIEINDYFIKGNLNNFKISLNSNPDYNRNVIIHLVRDIGVVYEIKKNIGRKCPKSKFGKKVTFLNTGDSFTRDGSFPRRITEVDRIKIRNLLRSSIENVDGFEEYEEVGEKYNKMNYETLKYYLEKLKSKDIASDLIKETFKSIKAELEKLRYIKNLSNEEREIIKEICYVLRDFARENDYKIIELILDTFFPLIYHTETQFVLKNECMQFLVQLYEQGHNFSDLIEILDKLGFFNGKLKKILENTIKVKDVNKLSNFLTVVDFYKHRDEKVAIMEMINENLKVPELYERDLKNLLISINKKISKY